MLVIAGVTVALPAACAPDGPATPLPFDLARNFARAEVRDVEDDTRLSRPEHVTDAGAAVPVVLMPAPARVTWFVRMEDHAILRGRVALISEKGVSLPDNARLRIGLSTNRTYVEVFRLEVDIQRPGEPLAWHPIDVDLKEFSGWHWSVFYHPEKRTWKLMVNVEGPPSVAAAWAGLTLIPAQAKTKRP